jgi:hypothetical protein
MAAQPLRVYAMALWNAEKIIANKLGAADLRRMPVDQRVILIVVDLVLALIIQALVEVNLITDAQIQAKIAALTTATYKIQPDVVPMGDEDAGTATPDPDLGA